MSKTLLTIDNGNSRPNVGIYSQPKDLECLQVTALEDYKVPQSKENLVAILSDVGKPHAQIEELKDVIVDLSLFWRKERFFDMPVHYTATLGTDRLYQSFYLYKNFLEKNQRILLIDAGTFTTVDVIDAEGFQGGFIIPGAEAYMQSYGIGAKLPLLKPQKFSQNVSELPHTTEDSLIQATTFIFQSFYQHFFQEFGPFDHIFLSGGRTDFHVSLLDQAKVPQLTIQPQLLHHAMWDIYHYYKEYQLWIYS